MILILYKTEFTWYSDHSREVDSTVHTDNFFN